MEPDNQVPEGLEPWTTTPVPRDEGDADTTPNIPLITPGMSDPRGTAPAEPEPAASGWWDRRPSWLGGGDASPATPASPDLPASARLTDADVAPTQRSFLATRIGRASVGRRQLPSINEASLPDYRRVQDEVRAKLAKRDFTPADREAMNRNGIFQIQNMSPNDSRQLGQFFDDLSQQGWMTDADQTALRAAKREVNTWVRRNAQVHAPKTSDHLKNYLMALLSSLLDEG